MDKKASSILAENFDNCLEELPWKNAEHAHFTMMGEDKFSQRCMDFHGVDKIPSTYEVGKGQKEGLHTTITCPAHIPKDLPKIKERITSRLVAKLGLLQCTHSKNQRTIS